jgi:hypothetical protein
VTLTHGVCWIIENHQKEPRTTASAVTAKLSAQRLLGNKAAILIYTCIPVAIFGVQWKKFLL